MAHTTRRHYSTPHRLSADRALRGHQPNPISHLFSLVALTTTWFAPRHYRRPRRHTSRRRPRRSLSTSFPSAHTPMISTALSHPKAAHRQDLTAGRYLIHWPILISLRWTDPTDPWCKEWKSKLAALSLCLLGATIPLSLCRGSFRRWKPQSGRSTSFFSLVFSLRSHSYGCT